MVHFVCLFSLLALGASAYKSVDQIWDEATQYSHKPLRVNDSSWGHSIVDPSTSRTFNDEAYFVFFYFKKCSICQKFKQQYDYIVNSLSGAGVHFAMVEVMENELIKETFNVKVSPWFALFKGDTMYTYEGSRSKESIKAFLEKDHTGEVRKSRITPLVSWFTLKYRYLSRYIDLKQPVWDRELDSILFRRLDLSHWPFEWKLGATVAVLTSITSLCLLSCFCLCCQITFNRREIKRLEKLRKERQETKGGETAAVSKVVK